MVASSRPVVLGHRAMPSADLACGGGCWAVSMPSLHLSLSGVSPQAAGPVSGAEGIHAVPPRGGLLPGPGPHRRRPAHAHAGRGMSRRLGGRGDPVAGTGGRVWVTLGWVLGSWHPFTPKARLVQRGFLCPRCPCCLLPAPLVPGSRVGAAGVSLRCSPAVPWLAASVLVPGADL